ncbi:MAG TPA: hypothetical protein VEX38_06885, partial [Fimbriimonadaceae bacterium]|nr:hypothetical protein [Fimbriimonadaceae bacterium]
MGNTRFDPKPYDSISLFGESFVVQAHPAAPKVCYGAQGRRAIVYQVRDVRGDYWALKVFSLKFRDPSLVESARRLRCVESFQGLLAAKRRIVLPSSPEAQQYGNLAYAMLMPWMRGLTWTDMLLQAKAQKLQLDRVTAVRVCERFLRAMQGLEDFGFAHSDISAGNVMFSIRANGTDVQLLDLEDLYMPGAPVPAHQNAGTAGYRHCSADAGQTFWCAHGDRYATAVLAAEMLTLANEKLRPKATDDGFFREHRNHHVGWERYREAEGWLRFIAPTFATLFERAWKADTLAECPRIVELRTAVSEEVAKLQPVGGTPLGLSSTPPEALAGWKPLAPSNPESPRKCTPVHWKEPSTAPAPTQSPPRAAPEPARRNESQTP